MKLIAAIRELDSGEGVNVYQLAERLGRMERAVICSLRKLEQLGRVRARSVAAGSWGSTYTHYSLTMPRELEGPGYRVTSLEPRGRWTASTARHSETSLSDGCYRKRARL